MHRYMEYGNLALFPQDSSTSVSGQCLTVEGPIWWPEEEEEQDRAIEAVGGGDGFLKTCCPQALGLPTP